MQRNILLKSETPVEEELFLVWEEMMAQTGEIVFRKREQFVREFIPIFQSFYSFISQDKEKVDLTYDSHARNVSLLEVLKESRTRDQIMGYSLRGVHKDELNMLLGDFPIKREGSQGQNKTYLVALKLAQFDFLKRTGTTIPVSYTHLFSLIMKNCTDWRALFTTWSSTKLQIYRVTYPYPTFSQSFSTK